MSAFFTVCKAKEPGEKRIRGIVPMALHTCAERQCLAYGLGLGRVIRPTPIGDGLPGDGPQNAQVPRLRAELHGV